MSKEELSRPQMRFIHDFSRLMTQWNMPKMAARIYCYLQLSEEPVSLDQIVTALSAAKSNVSTAAKLLVKYGCAERITEHGSRRIAYVVAAEPGALLRHHAELLGEMATMIRSRSGAIATGSVKQRLNSLANFDQNISELIGVASQLLPAILNAFDENTCGQ